MPAIERWSPFRELKRLQDEMDRLFESLWGRELARPTVVEAAWSPSVDVYETKDAIVIDAELPGVKPSDVKVTLTENTLTIKGEKSREKEIKEENYHRVERVYGSFARSFTLPAGVQADKIQATFKDGVLKITIPKAEEAKPKEIEIEVK